jgi:hypothetical protein
MDMTVYSVQPPGTPFPSRGKCPNGPGLCYCNGACYGRPNRTFTVKTSDFFKTSPMPPIKIDLSMRPEFV